MREKVEDYCWSGDNFQEDYIQKFVIDTGGGELDTSSEEESSSSDGEQSSVTCSDAVHEHVLL